MTTKRIDPPGGPDGIRPFRVNVTTNNQSATATVHARSRAGALYAALQLAAADWDHTEAKRGANNGRA